MDKKMEIQICLSPKRDYDLVEVYNKIGRKAFRDLSKICLLSLVEPTVYDEKKIKSLLSEQNPEKKKESSPVIRINFTTEWKKEGILQIKKDLNPKVTISHLTKILIRQRISSELIPICFKKKSIILLDKDFIPILKNAKININQKPYIPANFVKPAQTEAPAEKEKVVFTENKTLSKADLPFEETSLQDKIAENKKEENKTIVELPIEETPSLNTEGLDEYDEEEEDFCIRNMVDLI